MIHMYQQVLLFNLHVLIVFVCVCVCVFLLAANGAVQNSGKRNEDESVLKRRVGSGPEGGPGPEREGGGRHVANGELLLLSYGTISHLRQVSLCIENI